MYKKMLLILLSTVGAKALAGEHVQNIVNDTTSPLKVKLEYHDCKNDHYELMPGEKVEDRSGECRLKRIHAMMTREPNFKGERTISRPHMKHKHMGIFRKTAHHQKEDGTYHIFERKSDSKLTILRKDEDNVMNNQ